MHQYELFIHTYWKGIQFFNYLHMYLSADSKTFQIQIVQINTFSNLRAKYF